MVEGTGLEEACHVCNTPGDFIEIISELYDQPVQAREIENRKDLLDHYYSNKKNAEEIIKWLF
jgi:hypothetical protein